VKMLLLSYIQSWLTNATLCTVVFGNFSKPFFEVNKLFYPMNCYKSILTFQSAKEAKTPYIHIKNIKERPFNIQRVITNLDCVMGVGHESQVYAN